MEMVDLNRAVEHVFPRHHQAQCMSHPPGCRLAHSKDPGVPYRGQAPGEGRLAGGWHSLHLQCLKLENWEYGGCCPGKSVIPKPCLYDGFWSRGSRVRPNDHGPPPNLRKKARNFRPALLLRRMLTSAVDHRSAFAKSSQLAWAFPLQGAPPTSLPPTECAVFTYPTSVLLLAECRILHTDQGKTRR